MSVPTSEASNSTGQESITVSLLARRAVLDCAATEPSKNTALVQNTTWDGKRSQETSTKIYTEVVDTCAGKPDKVLPFSFYRWNGITSYGADHRQSSPPRTDEASMRYVRGTQQYPVVDYLQNIGIFSTNDTFKAEAAKLGTFFLAVIPRKDGVPAEQLVGEANISRLTSAVSKMYGRYISQVMSRKMRVPLNSIDQAQPLQVTLTERKSRLAQHSAPEVALQVLLGTMMLCGILSWILMPNVRILPHDPCSIAGMVCLLAGKGI
ncbi:hypothetical protein BU25DRAFT_111749 [Macroventuria anomochaeta]|uniref:Uncharacterized protein n=1 Tax=Macroventuria anomochaeta TaxID=301207 RepID=A0ACB6RVQ6_9PLEO|nr:uncharacterized protein BU25DRAFT_111749 [Macroventuria anomochaeta]KAF2625813.1 hypothetical protein BU25DRAFT_111749 [Macroventuria anomochaeta]